MRINRNNQTVTINGSTDDWDGRGYELRTCDLMRAKQTWTRTFDTETEAEAEAQAPSRLPFSL